jgi:hypothetical protein
MKPAKVLKLALSYLKTHEGLSYERALLKISGIIVSGDAENNPVLQHIVEAGLPGDPEQLHQLMKPGTVHG